MLEYVENVWDVVWYFLAIEVNLTLNADLLEKFLVRIVQILSDAVGTVCNFVGSIAFGVDALFLQGVDDEGVHHDVVYQTQTC